MPRESGINLEKVTLNLVSGDKELLASYYSAMGWSVAARKIVHKYCQTLREKDSQEVQANSSNLDIALPSMEDIGS